jgi:2,3-bisphosphoglycerate-independent phosphoglycerate mutase
VLVPEGTTGDVDTDLAAKRDAVLHALAEGRLRTVVHVGGADEAAHRLDPDGKITFLERVDRELLAPLSDVVAAAGATLRVCPDHGCDPLTGRHSADPVPHVTWSAAAARSARPRRLTERAVATLDVTDLTVPDRLPVLT